MSNRPTSVRHTDSVLAEERGAVSALLEANAERREAAEAELRAARQGLQELLLRGHAAGMQVADMARKAQISRDTAHRALKETLDETGEMTWKEKQAWAGEVMAHIPGGDHEKNEFRMFVNMLLLKALGKNPEGLPQSVKGLLDEAARDMKTIAGKPNFKPDYDPVILSLAWPGAPSGRTTGRTRRRRVATQDAAETLPGRESGPSRRSRSSRAHRAAAGRGYHTSNRGGTMKALSFKLTAAAAVVAAVVSGSAASAAGTGWHVMPVHSLGQRVGSVAGAAVNDRGTSIVVFRAPHSLTVVRRTANGSRFRIAKRIAVPWASVFDVRALNDGRFLLVYGADHRLVARSLDSMGLLRGAPHVLAPDFKTTGQIGDMLSAVVVDSDASRAVVVWGPTKGKQPAQVVGAVDTRTGWSRTQTFYSVSPRPGGPFTVGVFHDSADRFLVSLHGTGGDTTAVMWELPGGSRQWEQVTPPQEAGGSVLAAQNGATVAAVNGTITAAWQKDSGALVVSSWDGSTWTTPALAIPARKTAGYPVTIYPQFASSGSRAGLIWCDQTSGGNPDGQLEATIRVGATGSWSEPLVFPHPRCEVGFLGNTFWFTSTGELAGVWQGRSALYFGRVGASASSSITLFKSPQGYAGLDAVLHRSHGLTTVLWENGLARNFSATASKSGVLGRRRPLPACGNLGTAASSADASAQVLAIGAPGVPIGSQSAKCRSALLW